MPLRLYNSLSKHEEDFTPRQARGDTSESPLVSMYTCGPTVYSRPHIGNYSSFLMADLLRRWMEAGHGWTVKHVKNITDVGHLLHDADQGDDKIQSQAEKEKVHPLEIAKRYTEQYLEDEKTLNILEPFARPRATEFVEEMKAMIEVLLERGFAYVTDDGIYFDTASKNLMTPYGKLSGNLLENIAAGSRVEVNEKKKHPADFALWKFCVGNNAHHVLRWPSPKIPQSPVPSPQFPEGFPGWHIECSAMSRSIIGDTIDIHTGGEDNIFPHHECEIAQSEQVTQKPFVRLFLHKRRIDLGDQKMSKSLGNVLNISDILAKGYSAQDLRYYLLSVHYRTPLKFSWKGMDDAKKARRKITEWIDAIEAAKPVEKSIAHWIDKTEKNFADAMNSDLNTPAALADIFGAMNFFYAHPEVDEKNLESYRAFIKKIRHVFGCFDPEKEEGISAAIQALVDERDAARKGKDFAASDRLRKAIEDAGYELRDTKDGQVVKRK